MPARLQEIRRKADTAAENTAPRQGNTVPVEDGEATKNASEGRRSHKEAPKKILTHRLKPFRRCQHSCKNHTDKETRQPKTQLPDGERPCQCRTEKPQRSAEKVPNVSSETFPKVLETMLPARLQKIHRKGDIRQPKTRLPDRENTMPVSGEATKKRRKNA